MLTQEQERLVVQALIKAYYQYRDLPLLKIWRKEKILLVRQSRNEFSGEYGRFTKPLKKEDIEEDWLLKQYLKDKDWYYARRLRKQLQQVAGYGHRIEIPKKNVSWFREWVFWHEFGHLILGRLRLFPSLEGRSYRDYVTMHWPEYWEPERFCDAFADAMILYRKGVSQDVSPDLAAFFLADKESLSYCQMSSFSADRLEKYLEKARAEQRNLPLHKLEGLIHALRRVSAVAEFQPLLPSPEIYHLVYFQNHYRLRYMDEEKDEQQVSRLRGTISWIAKRADEIELDKLVDALRFKENQLLLLPEVELDEEHQRQKLREKLIKEIEKYLKN